MVVDQALARGDGEMDVLFPEHALRKPGGGFVATHVVFDSGRNRLVRFGGNGYPLGFPPTSEWDGTKWVPVVTANVPTAREGFRLAYDASRARVVLFGGTGPLDETWTYNGVNWTRASPANRPPARYDHGMVYDSGRQRVIVHGGKSDADTVLDDTWEWNGTTWTQVATATTVASAGHQLVYDPTRNLTLRIGGTQLWQYDGSNWSDRTALDGYPGNSGPAAFNPARGLVELFGGTNSGGTTAPLWTFRPSNPLPKWTSANITVGPGRGSTGYTNPFITYLGATGTAITMRNRMTYAWNGSAWSGVGRLDAAVIGHAAWGDVDGDGRPDRVATFWMADATATDHSAGKALFLNTGGALAPTPAWTRHDGLAVTAVALGDINNNGRLDAAFGHSSSTPGRIEYYAHTGTASFYPATPTWQSSSNYTVAGLALADINGDGWLDLAAVTGVGSPQVHVFLSNAGVLPTAPSISFALPPTASIPTSNYAPFAWADVTYDGRLECVVGYSDTAAAGGAAVSVLALNADATALSQIQRIEEANSPLALTDVNGDGYPDLIAIAVGGGPGLFRNPDGAFDTAPFWTSTFHSDTPSDIAAGDFDGDGDPDFVVAHWGSSNLINHLLYRNEGGTFPEGPS